MSSTDEILKASKEGDYDRVLYLLDADPALATASSMLGSQPIHAAHFGGHKRIVELLLARGVDLDFFLAAELGMMDRVVGALGIDPELAQTFSAAGSTALHRACYWGQTAVTRVLLERGADANAVTRDNFLQIAPLGCAVATPDVPNPSDDENVVLELMNLLIGSGANVNARRRDGLTALHSAAYRGHLKVIGLLLERGADPAIRGYEGAGLHAGQTAADVAVAQGQSKAAAALRAA
ncbi:MAG TPA: ankyrin repeat domain-containing protein [Bryobacteraceae bacterium]|jgi:cytohesin